MTLNFLATLFLSFEARINAGDESDVHSHGSSHVRNTISDLLKNREQRQFETKGSSVSRSNSRSRSKTGSRAGATFNLIKNGLRIRRNCSEAPIFPRHCLKLKTISWAPVEIDSK